METDAESVLPFNHEAVIAKSMNSSIWVRGNNQTSRNIRGWVPLEMSKDRKLPDIDIIPSIDSKMREGISYDLLRQERIYLLSVFFVKVLFIDF